MKKTTNSVPEPSVSVKKAKKKFKIPQFSWRKCAIFVLLPVFLILTGWIVYQFITYKVYRVMVSNVSSRSATISWVTEDPEPGMVVYREGSSIIPFRVTVLNAKYAVDDRDYSEAELAAAAETQENFTEEGDLSADNIQSTLKVTELGEYWTHHVTLRNLTPEMEYEFLVGNGVVFKEVASVNTENTTFTTMEELEEITTPDPAYGIVRYFHDEEFVNDTVYLRLTDAVVYATMKDEVSGAESEFISSTTNDEGGWYMDFSNASVSNGSNFIKSLGTSETTDINVYFTVEGVGFGRWTIVKNVEDCAPSDSFDLVDIYKEENSDLELGGYSLIQARSSLFDRFITDTFALPIEDWSSTEEQVMVKDDTGVMIVTKSTAEKHYDYNGEGTSSKQNMGSTIGTRRQSTSDNDVTDAGGNADNWEPDEDQWVPEGTTGYGGSDAEAVGTCRGDVCDGGGTCGWVNDLDCRCVCSGSTIDIEPGTGCRCSSSTGAAVQVGEAEVPLSESAADLWMGGDYCSNDSTKTSKACWSATNGCWYSSGHNAQNGLECTSEGRWQDPDNTITDNPLAYTVVENDPQTLSDCLENPDHISAIDLTTSKLTCTVGSKKFSVDDPEMVYCKRIARIDGECKKTVKKFALYCPSGWESTAENTIFSIGAPDEQCGNSVAETMSNVTPSSNCLEGNTLGSNFVMSINGKVYKCVNGKYEEASSYYIYSLQKWTEIKAGGTCNHSWDKTFIDGKLYKCKGGTWKEIDVGGRIMAPVITESFYDVDLYEDDSDNNNTCPADAEKCYCTYRVGLSSHETLLNPGETCGVPASDSKLELVNDDAMAPVVLAAENSTSKYLIDTETGLVSGFNVGVYSFELNGQKYVFEVTDENLQSGSGFVELYADVNINGKFDEEVDIIVSDESVLFTVSTLVEGFSYSIKTGYNLVSFPFIFESENRNMASELLSYLNNSYEEAFFSIAKFDSGRWQVVGSNGGNFDQNDFQIIPGEGYLLKAKWDLDITLYGKEIEFENSNDSAPIRFIPGWNLVGLYGSGVKSYTAQSLLEDISTYKGLNFTAVNVSRWLEERSMYEGLQREADGSGTMQVYGLDFPITKKDSYFVKVTSGSGNWEPGLR